MNTFLDLYKHILECKEGDMKVESGSYSIVAWEKGKDMQFSKLTKSLNSGFERTEKLITDCAEANEMARDVVKTGKYEKVFLVEINAVYVNEIKDLTKQ